MTLSNELVELLSNQMYQSPMKAIEELVVNAYDAAATSCRVFVPSPVDARRFVSVYDDGIGMDFDGLTNLWQIGRSNKRSEEIERRAGRKQIGKFGIGKLASYTIARFITYISSKAGVIRFVTLDYSKFSSSATGATEPVTLSVREIIDKAQLNADRLFLDVCAACEVDAESLLGTANEASWTFCVLEGLKDKVAELKPAPLTWVLSTAMPLKVDFALFLNGKQITSSKAARDPIVTFSVSDLSSKRLDNLNKVSGANTGVNWRKDGDHLVCESFPNGVSGTVIITSASLYGGKSMDLERSHGFFIRVRDRLISEGDALFGLHPLSYEVFNRFRADLQVDDLDKWLTAPREGVTATPEIAEFRRLLAELFYEGRDRYSREIDKYEKTELQKREHERNYVTPRLVEHPIADVLVMGGGTGLGAEADESWFYMKLAAGTDISGLIRDLYGGRRGLYRFSYSSLGADSRMATFDPVGQEFTLNTDHELIREYAGDPRAAELLYDFVAAEALLEVYLRESDVPPHIAGEVLERRDGLFRSLAKDHPSSVQAIAANLRESKSYERDLEMAVIAAARALGFVATHVSGAGQPDGIARFNDHTGSPKTITLEAKSSDAIPHLAQLDMAGVAEHVRRQGAHGCLLVAPAYPGGNRGDESALSSRARADRISCWTVDELARVVEAAETRHITAKQVLSIVLGHFAPADVTSAVERMLSDPSWEMRDLYRAVIAALKELQDRLAGTPRTIDMVAGEVSREVIFRSVQRDEVAKAIRDLAHASQGGLIVTGDDTIHVNVSYEEIERRLNRLTAQHGPQRRPSTFRDV